MKKSKLWMFAAILICGAGVVLTACKGKKQAEDETSDEAAEYKKKIGDDDISKSAKQSSKEAVLAEYPCQTIHDETISDGRKSVNGGVCDCVHLPINLIQFSIDW